MYTCSRIGGACKLSMVGLEVVDLKSWRARGDEGG